MKCKFKPGESVLFKPLETLMKEGLTTDNDGDYWCPVFEDVMFSHELDYCGKILIVDRIVGRDSGKVAIYLKINSYDEDWVVEAGENMLQHLGKAGKVLYE